MIEDEGMDFSNLRETLLRLLPILLIGVMLMINAMVIVTQIVPQWQLYTAAQTELASAEAQIAAASSVENDDKSVLAGQVEDANSAFQIVAQSLLTPAQPEEILGNLYVHADESGVTITGVLTQQSALETDTDLYTVRLFRVHVMGNVPRLMNFVMRVQEARIPSVQIDNLSISENEDSSDLTMDILLYNSAHADGTILLNLPQMDIPTPFDPPGLVVETTDIGASAPQTDDQAMTPPETSAETLPEAVDAGRTPPRASDENGTVSDETACEAPATTFQIGETVVVDFNDDGALNVLNEPRTNSDPIEMIGLVHDNDHLRLISGPVCGQWQGSDVWYWLIDHNGMQGWVGEASIGDRWLCPLEQSECT